MTAAGNARQGTVAAPTLGNVWAIAWPMMLTYVSVPLMGFASVTVMGHLEDPRYLAGVGLGTNFFAFFYFLFAFIRWTSTGLSAQAKGRALTGLGTDELAVVIIRGLSLGIGIGLVLLLLRGPLSEGLFDLFAKDEALRYEAKRYASARLFGAPALLGTYALTGWFIGSGRPRAVMTMTITANIANVALLLLFVEGLGYRSFGAGMAASLAEWLGLVIGLVGVWRTRDIRFSGLFAVAWRDGAAWRALFSANMNILIKTLFTLVVFMSFLGVSGNFTPIVLAANLVLMQLFYFASYAFDGFANACEAIAGQAKGAGRPELVRRALVVSLRCALVTSLLFVALYGFGGVLLIGLMTDLPDVRDAAFRYLPWMIVMPFCQFGSSVMDGVFVGTLRHDHLRSTTIVGALASLAAGFPAVRMFGNDGLWFALCVFFVARYAISWVLFVRDEKRAALTR